MIIPFKDYSKDIEYAERFQVSKYSYYNNYQTKANHQLSNSKLIYDCRRTNTPEIILAEVSGTQQRLTNEDINIDQFFTRVYQTYAFHTDTKNVEYKQEFQRKHKLRKISTIQEKQKSLIQSLQGFVNHLTDSCNMFLRKLESMEQIQPQKIFFFQRWIAFEELLKVNTQNLLKSKQNYSMFTFKLMFEDLLEEITSGRLNNSLPLYVPSMHNFKYLMHPITLPLHGFLQKQLKIALEKNVEAPKIVFVNLDGKQSPFNLRAIKAIQDNLFYITIFKEYDAITESEQDQASSLVYSKIILNELSHHEQTNNLSHDHTDLKQRNTQTCKILSFPLNSPEVRQQFKKKNNNKKMNELDSSQDILFLFQNIIYKEIRQYNPDVIIVSYNGRLNIEQQHFDQIIRNLSLISDHRIILFPNLAETLKDAETQGELSEQELFLKNYMPYDELVNKQRFLTNIISFLNISSGTCNLSERKFNSQGYKYNMARKYGYLENLSSLNHFEYLQKYKVNFMDSTEMQQLLDFHMEGLLDLNKQAVAPIQQLIDDSIKDILESNFDPLLLSKCQALYNKFQQPELFQQYLNAQKKRLLCEGLSEKLISKTFFDFLIEKDKIVERDYRSYKFRLEHSKGQLVSFKPFTKFVVNQKQGHIIILSHLIGLKTVNLWGDFSKTDPNSPVILYQLPSIQETDCIHVNFSFCLNNKYLYLFWPQVINLREYTIYKLLGAEYKTTLSNRFWRYQIKKNVTQTKFIELKVEEGQKNYRPRFGGRCHSLKDDLLYIFGGIYADQNDFMQIPESITKINITKDIVKLQPINTAVKLLPKMNYKIINIDQKNINITGGYGRKIGNLFSLVSQISYKYYFDKDELTQIKHPLRAVKIERQLVIDDEAKHKILVDITKNGKIKNQVKVSRGIKAKLYFEKNPITKSNINNADMGIIQEIIDQTYFKASYVTEHNKVYLFGITKKLKQNIYSSYYSPELYIYDGIGSHRIQICVETIQQQNLKMAKYFFPSQETIFNFGIHENTLYLIMMCQKLTNNICVLQTADLRSIKTIIQQRKILMNIRFRFEQLGIQKFQSKTMFFQDYNICLLGGEVEQQRDEIQRHDLIMQYRNNHYILKTRKLISPESTEIQLLNPFAIQINKEIYAYGFTYNQQIQNWQIKMEKCDLNFDNVKVTVSPLRIFSLDYTENKRKMIQAMLDYPRIAKICKYRQVNRQTMNIITEQSLQALNQWIKRFNAQSQDMKKQERQEELKFHKSLLANLKQIKKINLNSYQQLRKLRQSGKVVLKKLSKLKDSQQQLKEILKRLMTWVNKKQLEIACLEGIDQTDEPLYNFIMQDSQNTKQIKYFAISKLNNLKLNFIKVKFNREILISHNHSSADTLIFNLYQSLPDQFQIIPSKLQYIEEPIEFLCQEKQLKATFIN